LEFRAVQRRARTAAGEVALVIEGTLWLLGFHVAHPPTLYGCEPQCVHGEGCGETLLHSVCNLRQDVCARFL
jgi:hypothetical protein